MKREGMLTRAIEKRTAKIPSIAFLGIAGGAIAASMVSLLTGKKQIANFIGQWVPTVLMLGVYNKLVKEAT